MRSFLNKVYNTARNFGHRVNRTFNTVKHHARAAIPHIRRVASAIHEGAKNFSTLPVVGTVASQIGAVAGAVHRGTHIAERGLNAAENFQRNVGWAT